MKKLGIIFLTLAIILCMVLSLYACGGKDGGNQGTVGGDGTSNANVDGGSGSNNNTDGNASNNTGDGNGNNTNNGDASNNTDDGNTDGDGTGGKAQEATVGLEFELLDDDTYGVKGYQGTAKQVFIPDTYNGKDVTVIMEGAFAEAEIVGVTIGEKVIEIGESAFEDSYLASVVIPDSVMYIGDAAFKYSELYAVTIGKNVLRIGEDAFENINILYEVYNKSELPIEQVLLDEEPLGLYGPADYYRYSSYQLHSFGGIGKYILNLYTEPYTSKLSTENGIMLYSDGGEVTALAFVGEQTTLVLPDKVTQMLDYAFCGSNLVDVTIGTGIKKIPEGAFEGCEELTTVTMPASITYLAGFSFYDCDKLTTIHYGGTKEQWLAIGRGTYYTAGWISSDAFITVHCTDGDVHEHLE